MYKKTKHRFKRKKLLKKDNKSNGIIPVLLIVALISLFSETMRSIPVGAFSDNFSNISYKVPKLNSDVLEKKYINDSLKFDYVTTEKANIHKTKDPFDLDRAIKEKEEELIIAKIIVSNSSFGEEKLKIKEILTVDKEAVAIEKEEKTEKNIIDVPKVEETIKLAAETKTKSITINGEETLIPGSSDKNITYMQILQNPNDLDLNLKYAKQQSDVGNFKQTIATLERLNMLYPDNLEIIL